MHGVDHDPQALVATLDNAAYNDLSRAMQVFMPSELPDDAHYEVVVANILANPLIELAEEISARLLVGGRLVLAGLLAGQAESVRAAYPAIEFEPAMTYRGSAIAQAISALSGFSLSDFDPDATRPDDDWVCLYGRKAQDRKKQSQATTREDEQAL